MSRKTMDVWPELYNIYPAPRGTRQQNDDPRAQALIDGYLNDETVTRVPPTDARLAGHLEGGAEDLKDAVWGINEGKRDVRNWRTNSSRR